MIKGTKYVQKERRGARLTTVHKYMKGAVASRGKQIFFLSVSKQVCLVKQIWFRKKNHYFVHL